MAASRSSALRDRAVVAALSVTSELTRGHPPGEAMRACLVATGLARRAGLRRPRPARRLRPTALVRAI